MVPSRAPAEAKWGYTTLSAADWDHDGLTDLVVNSIWGKVVWYRNIGSPTEPQLSEALPIVVDWESVPPKPAWNWWDPQENHLVTQWRTTPVVVDWDEDGLNDLIMLDHEGYLAWYRRTRSGNDLRLLPGKRVFAGGEYDRQGKQIDAAGPLRLNPDSAGKSGRRKLSIVDLDRDGQRDLLVNSRNADLFRSLGGDAESSWRFDKPAAIDERKLAGHTTSPTTVDFDGDGWRDIIVGAEDGFFYFKRNPFAPRSNRPSKPATENGAGVMPSAENQTKGVSRLQRNRAPLNVLFIAVDDLRVELGCYGNTVVKSPHIDSLANRGTLFERAYCQQAVCNPSRASVLTGRYPWTLGVFDLSTHFRDKHPDATTLPQYFKEQGYFTQNIGKIFHNWHQPAWQGDARSWSVPSILHYAKHSDDIPEFDGQLPRNLAGTPRCERRDLPDAAYFDGRIAQRSMEALETLSRSGQPWFLGVGFWKPHLDFNPPLKYWELYDREHVLAARNPDPPLDVPEIALHDSRELLRSFDMQHPEPEQCRELRHGYCASISFVDAQIGKVIEQLDRLGLTDSTVIVVWSDHGFHLGEHQLWAKTSNFELDLHVPLIVVSPLHRGSQRTDALVELVDLFPTLIDLCGLPSHPELEGISLRPLLENPAASLKRSAVSWHPRPAYPRSGRDPDAMGYSLRTDRFRYSEWRDFRNGRVIARELYDHNADTLETVNLAARKDHHASVSQLASLLSSRLHLRAQSSTAP